MMDFSELQNLTIPEGVVERIRDEDGTVLWAKNYLFRYVSFGDSIAAGHTINDRWEEDYGEESQYGKNGNESTVIVPGCYTDLIRNRLIADYGVRISAKSFGRSGDTVEDLIEKLTHETVITATRTADLVTICIGANDVLGPALRHLEEYILAGDSALDQMAAEIAVNLARLANDDDPGSYKALFDRLTEINPNAEIVFTTIYNPYKYLWLEEGTDGFFSPLLDTIPDITILGFDVDGVIKDGLLDTDIMRLVFKRVNQLAAWSENHVTQLNSVLRQKVNEYQAINKNIKLCETKILYEVFPDRPVAAEKHYNDLVSVEYTRGYDTAKMDWGQLWKDSSAATFWLQMAEKYVSLSGVDIAGFAEDLIPQVVEKVILPDVDPHPEEYGHYVLMRSFLDALGWTSIDRHTIRYFSNDSNGAEKTQYVVGVDGIPAFTTLLPAFASATEGYYFANWNTAADGSGTAYGNQQYAGIASDLDLYAVWSNIYYIRYRHSNKTNLYTDDETGHKENYALKIAGEMMRKLGTFSNDAGDTYAYPYGTLVEIAVTCYDGGDYSFAYDDKDAKIYYNGVQQAIGQPAYWSFPLKQNVDIDFQWKIAGSLATLNAQSWWDCYVTD